MKKHLFLFFVIMIALVLIARFVIFRKNPDTSADRPTAQSGGAAPAHARAAPRDHRRARPRGRHRDFGLLTV